MATLKLKPKTAKAWIKAEYPELFTRPMAINIVKEIMKVRPEHIQKNQIRWLLYDKTMTTAYQRVLIKNDNRYHLDGSIMGIVPEKHKILAKNLLVERGKDE